LYNKYQRIIICNSQIDNLMVALGAEVNENNSWEMTM